MSLTGGLQRDWLECLEREHDNIRAALEWSLVSDVEAGVALAGSLWRLWWMHGYLDEGRAHLAKLLASSPPSASRARAKALNAAGLLALWQGDFGPAHSDLLGSLALAEQIDDGSSAAFALMFVGRVYRDEGDVEASRVR